MCWKPQATFAKLSILYSDTIHFFLFFSDLTPFSIDVPKTNYSRFSRAQSETDTDGKRQMKHVNVAKKNNGGRGARAGLIRQAACWKVHAAYIFNSAVPAA